MLSLRNHIKSNQPCISRLIRQHEHFTWACRHINRNILRNQNFRRRDVFVAWTDDFSHGRKGFCSVSQSSYSLGASNSVDLIDSTDVGGDKHKRVMFALSIRRRTNYNSWDSRYFGRNRIHNEGAWISGLSTWNVTSDTFDWTQNSLNRYSVICGFNVGLSKQLLLEIVDFLFHELL